LWCCDEEVVEGRDIVVQPKPDSNAQRSYLCFSKEHYVYNKTGAQPISNVLLQRNVTETTGRNIF
jgi:hypothetical protein